MREARRGAQDRFIAVARPIAPRGNIAAAAIGAVERVVRRVEAPSMPSTKPSLLDPSPSWAQPELVSRLRKLKGKVKYEDRHVDRPVIEVRLGGTAISDDDLGGLEAFADMR